MHFSINNYYGEQVSKCGYCKKTNCSVAHGMHAYTMTPQDYQDLIDRGWRRSGLYLYKPNNRTTCCPLYTIKCDALNFKLSKSHKKVLKRMNRFLRDGKKDKSEVSVSWQRNERDDSEYGAYGGSEFISEEPKEPKGPIPEVNLAAFAAANTDNNKSTVGKNPINISKTATQSMRVDNNTVVPKLLSTEQSDVSRATETMNPPCKKAKQMRLERRREKLAAKGVEISNKDTSKAIQNQEKTLSDYLNEAGPNDKHKLKIVIVASHKLVISDEALNLYRKYQIQIHNDSPTRLTPANLQRFLYKSPLKHCKPSDGPPDGYGSFHQQYWLDEKLIAVAVIDILPYCISSVYFFYDPDYSFLSLGTYGSLREIEFVQQLAKVVPALKYYYMGFYIHSCPKMRYKGKLVPSYLLCPETYTWTLLTDEIRARLEEHKYQRFNADLSAKDVNSFSPSDLDKVLLLVQNNKFVTYARYVEITGDDDDRHRIIEYGELVGKQLGHRMLFLKY